MAVPENKPDNEAWPGRSKVAGYFSIPAVSWSILEAFLPTPEIRWFLATARRVKGEAILLAAEPGHRVATEIIWFT